MLKSFASPSPRKAWIETKTPSARLALMVGRLPPGRRGLKLDLVERNAAVIQSPSPRKAWIETRKSDNLSYRGVRRLPPGRRGLKHTVWLVTLTATVAFPPEGVD